MDLQKLNEALPPALQQANVSCRFCQMKIINPNGTVDTEKQSVILVFNDDDELSSFISLLVKTPVRSTGVRVLPIIPDGVELTQKQTSVLSILEGLDGIGGDDNESICDKAIDRLKDILKS